MAKRGKREFVPGAAAAGSLPPRDVLAGIREAIARGAIGFDAVKHLVLVPDRAPAAAARHDGLPLPAAGKGGDDLGKGLSRPPRWRRRVMSDTPQLLLVHHLKALRLPTFLREYDKLASMRRRGRRPSPLFAALGRTRTDRAGTPDGRAPHQGSEVPDTVKSLDSFDFTAIPRSTRHCSWSWPAASTSCAART